MAQLNNCLKAFIICYLTLLQAGWSLSLRQSVVQIFSEGKFLCGGTLVRKNFVVTAAHCVLNSNLETLLVSGGITAPNDISAVYSVYIPKTYDPNTRDMDVAVLQLETNLNIIKPTGLCNRIWSSGSSVTVYPWDIEQHNQDSSALNLKAYTLYVASRFQCWLQYQLPPNNHMFCGASSKNVNFRDTGGPVEFNGQFCGIVSRVYDYVNSNAPALFVDTRSKDVLEFINSHITD